MNTYHSTKHTDKKEHLANTDLVFTRIPTISYFQNQPVLIREQEKRKPNTLFTSTKHSQADTAPTSFSLLTDYSTPVSCKPDYQYHAMKLSTFEANRDI